MFETVAGWLRSPAVRRGLLVAGFLTGCFVWTMAVIGLSFGMVDRGAQHWWLVLVFGLLVLLIAVAAGYGFLLVSVRRADGEPGVGAVSGPARPPPTPAGPPVEPLSQREIEVLAQLAAGRSNREIARALYVAPGTVKAHLNHIFRKLGATSRLHAVARAREAGILDAGEQNKPR
jgi:DNA-binding CsgD family transcriptional regulator